MRGAQRAGLDFSIASPVPDGHQPSRRWAALAVLCLSLLIVTLDNTVLNVALPTLVRDLHATSTELQWIVDSYVMVFAGLLLVGGSLADRVGRKRTFVAGLLAFASGSAWAAFSGSVNMLIAARASMGIGGALIMPSTLSIITDMFRNPAERQRAIGVWSGTSGLGIALGPIIGGALLVHLWWGSIFLINVPIAVAGVALALPLVPDSKNPAAQRPDYGGALLSMAGLALLLWSIIEGPVDGWLSARVLATGASGLVILMLFTAWERRSTHPMLNLAYFGNRAFSGAISSVGLGMFALMGALFLMTQFLQFDLGYTALQAGIRTLPAAGAIAVVAPMSSLIVRWIGTRLTVAAGLLVTAAGLWQVSGAGVTSTYMDTLAGMILVGVGAGLTTPSATASVMGSVPQAHLGVGSGTNGASLQVGGAVGVAVVGSLLSTRYQHRMNAALAGSHLPHAVQSTILGSLGAAEGVARSIGGATGEQLLHLARGAFMSGMALGLAAGAAVAAVAGLLAMAVLPPRARAAPKHAPAEGGTVPL